MASDKVNYREVGVIAQAIKYQIRAGEFWEGMGGPAKESLDQIATSIARMVAGDGVHWDAIIGYAHAAKPGADMVEPEKPLGSIERVTTEELERSIRKMARDIPTRNGAP